MPQFLKMEGYQPQDYTKGDFLQYQYLQELQKNKLNVQPSGVASVKRPSTDMLYQYHVGQLKLCNETHKEKGADFYKELGNALDRNAGTLLELLESESYDLYFESRFVTIRQAFAEAVREVSESKLAAYSRDPEEFAPQNRSLQYLKMAERPDLTPEQRAMHEANLAFVNADSYITDCEQEFVANAPPKTAQLKPATPAPTPASDNAGFLLKVYRNPRFRHWLTQLLLAAIVLTAALVIMTCMIQVTLLPIAVASVVKGLSTMAVNTIFGASCIIGAAAAATLATSLYARFFGATQPSDRSAGPAPASSNNQSYR